MSEVFGQNHEAETPAVQSPEVRKEQLEGLRRDVEQGMEQQLQKKSLTEVMDALGIPSSYNDRYSLIHQLYEKGVILFDGSLNPYTNLFDQDITPDLDEGKYQYIGNPAQNEKFKSQLIRNRHLFVNGKLPAENVSKWQLEGNTQTTEIKQPVIERSEVEGKNLGEILQALGIGTDYNSRFDLAQHLDNLGIKLFPTNTYFPNELENNSRKESEDSGVTTFYIGEAGQNAKLRRNLIQNSALFVNGKVSPANAKKWELVK